MQWNDTLHQECHHYKWPQKSFFALQSLKRIFLGIQIYLSVYTKISQLKHALKKGHTLPRHQLLYLLAENSDWDVGCTAFACDCITQLSSVYAAVVGLLIFFVPFKYFSSMLALKLHVTYKLFLTGKWE